MQEKYRKLFNSLDKHNSVRQGGACFETSWNTMKWFIRDFQMLWGMSEVNAWLLWKFFLSGERANVSLAQFRRRLCYQMLSHPLSDTPGRHSRSTRSGSNENMTTSAQHHMEKMGKLNSRQHVRRSCVYCGARVQYHCPCDTCVYQGKQLPGIPLCEPRTGRNCFARHIAGHKFPNRKSEALTKRHQDRRN